MAEVIPGDRTEYVVQTHNADGPSFQKFATEELAMGAWRASTERYSRRVLMRVFNTNGEMVLEETLRETIPQYTRRPYAAVTIGDMIIPASLACDPAYPIEVTGRGASGLVGRDQLGREHTAKWSGQYTVLIGEDAQRYRGPLDTLEAIRDNLFHADNDSLVEEDEYLIAVPVLVCMRENSASAEGARELVMEHLRDIAAETVRSGRMCQNIPVLIGNCSYDFELYIPGKSPPNTFEILQGKDE